MRKISSVLPVVPIQCRYVTDGHTHGDSTHGASIALRGKEIDKLHMAASIDYFSRYDKMYSNDRTSTHHSSRKFLSIALASWHQCAPSSYTWLVGAIPESTFQTSPPSVQPFLQGSPFLPNPTWSIRYARPLSCWEMKNLPMLQITAQELLSQHHVTASLYSASCVRWQRGTTRTHPPTPLLLLRAGQQSIGITLSPAAGPAVANLQQRVCCYGPILRHRQTDRRTDGHRIHKPCSAYYAVSANNRRHWPSVQD